MVTNYFKILALLLVLIASSCKNESQTDASDRVVNFPDKDLNPIDRYGDLLVAVQTSRIFPDGKTFVDCEPKIPSEEILKEYNSHKDEEGFDLKSFVLEYFTLPGTPTSNFESDTTRSTTEHINALWSYLKRDADAVENGSRIALPNAYIVPGGRFQEVYYWDSYFILLGLKEAGEIELIENILDNFAYQINTIGFIPNGNRTYYLGRSQPPFFAEMVNLLAGIKDEKTVYLKYQDALEKEYEFWMKGANALTEKGATGRVVKLADDHILNRYFSNTQTPRAESYLEDITTAEESGRKASEVYLNISAACESGWDFSSRWFADPDDIATIQTTDIIPVDLNALLYNLEETLAKARRFNDNTEGAEQMVKAASDRKDAIDAYLWDASKNTYVDYNLASETVSPTLSLAMVYPLYFKVASPRQAEAVSKTLEAQFLKPGGLVTSLVDNKQQWDSPNGWPPHQWLAVRGLQTYGFNNLAEEISTRWLHLNDRVYKRTGKMLEKYNVIDTTLVAGGGEYPTQDGFGWTNGVYLDLKKD
ncbi:alpha,alpha-trehalase [Leeuwenhoekiella aestuarii]|uniref:Alpha,alpha-trehalase n=1 Tax=Leeuwenhoekiella aestuarii TaxID=2249426 RepID=A0A4Q0NZJ2_9FLAO|nr:alpha,alpha-trehalase TreF [Leeuwenhoekiella aestuarii]RXG18111.1 alpha,alpha-trehalase [Leeuwenhoekiella aestuarii]RXG19417.1 alpha,alpha-trehalase [Leeuwenhoekiella aestuarii]